MKIEKEYLENHQAKITAAFEPELMESFMRRAARDIAKNHKIPGFRPGKAPYEVVKRNFGEEAIEQQAIELMLEDVYPKVLEEADINPSGPGSLNNVVSTHPPVFEFTIPLMPEVELGDYRVIRVDYHLDPVAEDEVEKVLENIRNSYATAVPVERPAQEGDLVSIKIKGNLTNPEEGEDAEIVKEFPHQVTLSEESDENNWPFAEFWKELIGVAADDSKKVPYQYPEDTPFSRFKNKEIEFEITVENVKEMEYPEMDDDFAKTLGTYETMEELRNAIVENLEKTRKEEYEQEYLSGIIDQVVESSTVKYAPNTLDEEIENVIATVQQDLANQNLDLETYLKFRNTDRETFISEEIKPIAVRRLERSLVLDSVARAEEIQISEEELKSGVTQTISQLLSMPDFKKPGTNQEMRKLTDVVSFDTATRILNQKVNECLLQIAKGEAENLDEEKAEDVAAEDSAADETSAETGVEHVPDKAEVEDSTETGSETAIEDSEETENE